MKNSIRFVTGWIIAFIAIPGFAQASMYQAKEIGEQTAWTQQQILLCTQKETDTRDQELIDKEVLFLRIDIKNVEKLVKSTTTLNDEQEKALKNFRNSLLRCRVLSKQFPLPAMVEAYQNYYQQIDQIYDDLLSRKITIGEANQKKLKLLDETQAKWNEIEDSIRRKSATQ